MGFFAGGVGLLAGGGSIGVGGTGQHLERGLVGTGSGLGGLGGGGDDGGGFGCVGDCGGVGGGAEGQGDEG